ncbi:exocyst complex component EXO70B1-like [Solanum tuberosum]|uniref:Exocyst subunit Exo70 family protein n=1 Tax=Solanum tuberosum TaxID=4113 RepID=M1AX18_SOLTU|nr:PREDICTED: exocyst complex component EXO70B1-like [Solanum tuberosum]KAH0720402.1 hypothetical protein KY284_005432 [Solanum tuberosum]
MGDSVPVPVLEGEEKLIAAAHQIVKALHNKKDFLTHDARKILADLGSQLMSSITKLDTLQQSNSKSLEDQLNILQNKIMSWEELEDHQSVIWNCGQEYVHDYLTSVDQLLKFTQQLESNNLGVDKPLDDLLISRAHQLVRTAMNRLQQEFKHLLVQNKQPFQPEHMSFRSNEDDDTSIASFGDDSLEDVLQRDSMSRRSEEYISVVELVHPDVIPDLRCIANLMFNSNYSTDCSQAFVNVRRDALDDFLFILEADKLCIDDVLKMEWNSLNSKIRRWIRCMNIFVRVYLASEKWLSDQIFGELDHSVSSVCFVESSKGSILHLLKFAESVAIGSHQPEKLIRILDMYEVLSDLMPDIDVMFSDDAGLCVRTECQHILTSLAGCARTTFLEFEHAVASSVSANPFRGGGIHHLTRYVMNYMKTLTDYSKILNELLKGDEEEEDSPQDMTPDREEEEEDNSNGSSCYISPLAQYFRSFTSILECNLDDKSKLYKDESLGHLFLMNNIHYMAEKVKNSHDLRTILGDDWIRKHNWRFQQHAMNYERATWSSILSLLREEGVHNPGSNSISRTLLKERLQCFYAAFDEVYKSQTGWLIQDSQLRDDLRISTSLKVIQAYRTFIGRHSNHISDKYIKYGPDDMENFLLDLFEGSPRSLHGSSHRGK